MDMDGIAAGILCHHFKRLWRRHKRNLSNTLRHAGRTGRVPSIANGCMLELSEGVLGQDALIIEGRILSYPEAAGTFVDALRATGYTTMAFACSSKGVTRADTPYDPEYLSDWIGRRRRFTIGSFGRENDACAISALSVIDMVPSADVLVHMDSAGLHRWGETLSEHGIQTVEWSPYDPVFSEEMIRIVGQGNIPSKADPDDIHAVCVRFFRWRMLLHYLRGGIRMDADTLVVSDPEGWDAWGDEFVISCYNKNYACCGVTACRANHSILPHWYSGMADKGDICEEKYFNHRVWRDPWNVRVVHGTQLFAHDVRLRGSRRKVRQWRDQAAWDTDLKWSSIIHYHSGRDRRVSGTPQYRYMSIGDIVRFPLEGDGRDNIVVGRMREIVDKYDLVARLGEG